MFNSPVITCANATCLGLKLQLGQMLFLPLLNSAGWHLSRGAQKAAAQQDKSLKTRKEIGSALQFYCTLYNEFNLLIPDFLKYDFPQCMTEKYSSGQSSSTTVSVNFLNTSNTKKNSSVQLTGTSWSGKLDSFHLKTLQILSPLNFESDIQELVLFYFTSLFTSKTLF